MQPFTDVSPLWGLSQPSAFSNSQDDEFFAMLQKQYSSNSTYDPTGFSGGINPQSLSQFSLNGLTPPSEESSSSPSPPNTTNALTNDKEDQDSAKKRRVDSDDDLDEDQPNHKTPHTTSSPIDRKASSSRRKGSNADDARLMKRKEQNRAAQRAFRERKEKHVKDLEDKVAALEAKNDQTQSENENLRDLLSRLQNENIALKQSSFTFAVPKAAATSSPNNSFYGSNLGASTSGTAQPSSGPSASADSFDWSSLTTLDPNMLSLLDDSPQATATAGAAQMDFGFGSSSTGPYTTIASNPDYMSFASYFDPTPPEQNNNNHNNVGGPFNFDMNSLTSWPTSSASSQNAGPLSDIFGGYGTGLDFESLVASTPSLTNNSLSPISHATPSTTGSSPNSSSFTTIRESVPIMDEEDESHDKCPKTKEEFARRIQTSGASPFAPSPVLTLKHNGDPSQGPTIMCRGSSFPKTPLSDKNVPLMDVWRDITANPEFKGFDINELCEEFSCKAKCDGTKVVLEPQVVDDIMESLTQKKQRLQQEQSSSPMRQ